MTEKTEEIGPNVRTALLATHGFCMGVKSLSRPKEITLIEDI
jgi:hypothetical protein